MTTKTTKTKTARARDISIRSVAPGRGGFVQTKAKKPASPDITILPRYGYVETQTADGKDIKIPPPGSAPHYGTNLRLPTPCGAAPERLDPFTRHVPPEECYQAYLTLLRIGYLDDDTYKVLRSGVRNGGYIGMDVCAPGEEPACLKRGRS